ncbi:MAG: glycosyltransferase [Candidatus Pacearchaeota archaeon]
MKKEKINWPKLSICTCTYNGERIIEKYFEGIFSQEYPKDKIEIILGDGGSKDKTLQVIKKYRKKYPKIIKFFYNKKKFSMGKGYGVDQATRKAKGEVIVLLDQDNILVQNDWLKNMVKILLDNKDVTAVQSGLFVPKKASIIDKYINAIGIEDPFVIHYSLNAQIVLNPNKFQYKKEENLYIYEVNEKRFYYGGSNGFAIRRKDFFESGGFTQDIDNFMKMAKSGRKYKIAVSNKIKLYHHSTTDLRHLLKKRVYYIKHYLLKNFEEREFYWFNLKENSFWQNMRFIYTVLFNLLFFPGLIQGVSMAIIDRKSYWLIHPFIIWIITVSYIYAFFYVLIIGKQREASI